MSIRRNRRRLHRHHRHRINVILSLTQTRFFLPAALRPSLLLPPFRRRHPSSRVAIASSLCSSTQLRVFSSPRSSPPNSEAETPAFRRCSPRSSRLWSRRRAPTADRNYCTGSPHGPGFSSRKSPTMRRNHSERLLGSPRHSAQWASKTAPCPSGSISQSLAARPGR